MHLILPAQNAQGEVEIEVCSPLVLVGANGAGKSRMGAFIEKKHSVHVIRVGAQKSLKIPFSISLMSGDQAESVIALGDRDIQATWQPGSPGYVMHRYQRRWGGGDGTSHLLNDIDAVLALLFARKRERDENAVKLYQAGSLADLPLAPHDSLIRIWNILLPNISITLEKDGIYASAQGNTFVASSMSDGERALIYLMAQVLLAKPGSILIIDEPELHLHKSIINKLWSLLEEERKDCFFIYATQDLEFATSRNQSTVVWVRSYSANIWDWTFVDLQQEVPAELLLSILGSRHRVLIAEGNRGSKDVSLYSLLFPDMTIEPEGGCQDVIRLIKAARKNALLRDRDVWGIVDRDYRSDAEIEHLRNEGIAVLDVAEVEHMFCVPEVVRSVGERACKSCEQIDAALEVIDVVYRDQTQIQTFKRSAAELREDLSIFSGARGHNAQDLMDELKAFYSGLDPEKKFQDNLARYEAARDGRDMLRLFNRKNLYKEIAGKLGLSPETYLDMAISEIGSSDTLRKALRTYILFPHDWQSS